MHWWFRVDSKTYLMIVRSWYSKIWVRKHHFFVNALPLSSTGAWGEGHVALCEKGEVQETITTFLVITARSSKALCDSNKKGLQRMTMKTYPNWQLSHQDMEVYFLRLTRNLETPALSGLKVVDPSFQLAGHTSPCSSLNWRPLITRIVSSTLRPTPLSLM